MIWRKLSASASQSVSGSIVFGDVIQVRDVSGDVSGLAAGRTLYRIDGFRHESVPLSLQEVREQPSKLLLAHRQVVPFAGRGKQLGDLGAWLDSDAGLDVRLIYAAGGQGKSRLARHFAGQQASTGWVACQVRDTPTARISSVPIPRSDRPLSGVLAVVDYADRWSFSHLKTLIADLCDFGVRSGLRVRVLLLARAEGSWWTNLECSLESDYAINATAVPLPPLDDQIDRGELFRQARQHFAAKLQVTGTDNLPIPPGLQAELAFTQVLAVHMAALVAVDARRFGGQAPTEPHTIVAYLLKRERAYWHALHNRAEAPAATTPEVMGRAVYVATLAGPLLPWDAHAALTRAKVTEPGVTTIIDDHRLCYPPQDLDTVLEGLLPDRLGEDFIALSTPGHPYGGEGGSKPDPLASTIVDDLLDDDSPAVWTASTITVLVETAQRWPHIATAVLYPLLTKRPELAFAGGTATLARLADLPDMELPLLQTIATLLPKQRRVDTDTYFAAIYNPIVRQLLAGIADPVVHARLHCIRARFLRDAGRYEEALESAEQAVAAYRGIATTADSAEHLPRLVESMTVLSNALAQLGRHEEALLPALEAVEIVRSSADTDRSSRLAGLLNNLGIRLWDLGRREESLAQLEEAVTLYQQLAEGQPATYAPEYASSLNNLGIRLAQQGRRDEAVERIELAVEIRGRLADFNPAVYRPLLASALSNLGNALAELGRHDEALAAAEKAVLIQRELAAISAIHWDGLASALTNLCNQLSDLGCHQQAVAPAQEAVAIYRQLAITNPGLHLRHVAASLSNLAKVLSGLAKHEHALEAAEEAVAIDRRLAIAHPVIYLPALVRSLNNLSISLVAVGQRDRAITAATEAAAISRRLGNG
ncbi:tetratricopeptide repeat protein [Kribbella rubisoli]|uniref:Tetratricopeptide repeat protein n=1 Tax=Kribbella rubisoli TaxID=3075929 RepID=A0A4Q7WN39_9ACTN|nr:tetratricopeptide repeat protein [Kribbella rubisoli]RZU11430.1 tetratricopeptide repeat protein [Kribbella rubisoli]